MNNSQQFEGTPSEGRTFSWGRVWLGCWTFVGVVLLLISISSAPMAVGKPAGAEECATIHTKEKAGSGELLPTQLTAPKFTQPNWHAANIEDIKAGDWVMAQDPESGEIAPKRVKEAYRRVVDHLQIVTIADEDGKVVQEFRTTAEHPFWVAGNGWVKAKELKPGSKVLQADGKHGKVVSNIREPHPEGFPVFNFQVEGFHTYFVSARGSRGPPVLVHNNNQCPNLIQIGTGLLRTPARLTQRGLEHIVLRHWHSSGFSNVGRFSRVVDARKLRSLIDTAGTLGRRQPDRFSRWRIEHTFRDIIGVNRNGKASKTLRLIIDQTTGVVVTAFPI